MEEIKKEKNTKEFWSKLIAGGLFVVSWLVLIGIRLSSDISLIPYLVVSIILTVIFVVMLFWKQIAHLKGKIKEKEKNPEPLSKEKIEEILKKEVKDMWNYIEKGVPIKRIPHNINNSIIYEHHLKLAREQELSGGITDEIIILINATSPDLLPAILPEDSPDLKEAINRLSKNPDNPDIEETEWIQDPFTKELKPKTKKVSYQRKPEEKEGAVV